MKTYYMGRFAIDVPVDFKLTAQSQRFRYAEIEEFDWPERTPREAARNEIWKARVAEISNLRRPKGIDNLVVRTVDIGSVGQWGKGILYYGNYMSKRDGYWNVLVDIGPVGLWIKLNGLVQYEEEMLRDIKEIVASYSYCDGDNGAMMMGGFHLKKGTITLPYLEQEDVSILFEGPMKIALRVQTREIHHAPKKEGLMERTIAAIETNFSPGLTITKIRSHKRTAAGLPGEEEILQGDDGRHKKISFDWEYLGSVESSERPLIQISMDTMAEHLEEKTAIWDKVLDSFRLASGK